MKRLTALASVGVIAVVGLVAGTGPAQAKVPGPNGQIVFVRTDFSTGKQNIYFVNPDGSHLRKLVFPWDVDVPHWSPSGSRIAFVTSLNRCPPTCLGHAHTVILNPDTGHYRILQAADPNLFTSCTVWSPDASHFACDGENDNNQSVNGLYTIRSSDGLGLKRITNAHGLADIPIDYSPDGSQIVFGRVDPFGHACTKSSAIFVVNVDGTGLHRITPWGFCDDDGNWSPDGKEIAFVHQTGRSPGSIFVVHPDGSGLAKIPLATNSWSSAGDVCWSPDGKKMVFILADPTSFGIATANAEGTDVQEVTSAPNGWLDHEADWGPHPLAT